MSWLGKSFDTFAPLGPCIVTADEIANPNDLHVRFWNDGQLRHNYNTDDMEHRVPELVEFASTVMTLLRRDRYSEHRQDVAEGRGSAQANLGAWHLHGCGFNTSRSRQASPSTRCGCGRSAITMNANALNLKPQLPRAGCLTADTTGHVTVRLHPS